MLIALRTGVHAGDVLVVCEMRWDVDLVPVQCFTLTSFEAGMPRQEKEEGTEVGDGISRW